MAISHGVNRTATTKLGKEEKLIDELEGSTTGLRTVLARGYWTTDPFLPYR
jgi:hypothetical protein